LLLAGRWRRIEGIPVVDASGGVDWGTGAFVLSFVLVVNWTLLQVTVAVVGRVEGEGG